MKILSFIISIQFILNPLFIPQTHAQSCDAGLQFNPQLNRCLTSNEVASVMQSTRNCSQTDHECYERNARAALSQNGNMDRSHSTHSFKSDNWGKFSKGMNIAVVATTLSGALVHLSKMKDAKKAAKTATTPTATINKCASISWLAMVGAGSILLASDLIITKNHKNQIEKIHEDWKKIVPDEVSSNADDIRRNGTEAQSQAFEMLARSEDQMVKTAKAKRNFYIVAGATFATAMAISIYEATRPAGSIKCQSEVDSGYEKGSGTTYYQNNFSEKITKLFSSEEKQQLYSELVQLSDHFSKTRNYNFSQAQNLNDLLQLKYESENLVSNLDIQALEDAIIIDDSFLSKEQFQIAKTILMGVWSEMTIVRDGFGKGTDPGILTENEVLNKLHDERINYEKNKKAEKAQQNLEEKQKKLMENAWGRAALALVLTTWAGVMADHAEKQANASAERAGLLREMKQEFDYASNAINVCGSEDRNNQSKPGCYCYNSDQSRNASRMNSEVCNTLWGKFKPKVNPDNSPNVGKLGCVSANGNFDSTCKCKQNKSCMKIGQNNINMNPGMFSVMNSGFAPINSMANSDFNHASFDSSGVSNNAMRMMNLNKKLLENKPKVKAQLESIAESFHNEAMRSTAGLPSSPLAENSNSPLPKNPAEAALMLEKEVESSNAPTGFRGNQGTLTLNPENSEELPDFGLSPSQATDNQVAEVMKENFDYKENDITKASDSNIFQVLSNRYHRSGFRRLFDDKGVTSADKPADSDISK